MTKRIFTALCISIALAGIALAAVVYDTSNFTVNDRKWQPAPNGHLAGKDNGNEPGGSCQHPGENCGICHREGGKARNRIWTMSGTVYETRSYRAPLQGAEVIFQNYSGKVFSMTTNDLGDFWTTIPFSNNPGNTDPGKWIYKAWVRSGEDERPMPSLAPVGGSGTNTRMSCSMHHAGMGSRGGLWVQNKSTLPSYPAASLSYRKHIFPILRSKCAPCHIPGDTTARKGSETEPPFDSSYGLDLMTYEGSAVFVPGSVPHGSTVPNPDRTWVKIGVRDVVNTVDPASSLLLTKPMNGSSHAGGNFWSTSDADYRALRQWIAEGALKN